MSRLRFAEAVTRPRLSTCALALVVIGACGGNEAPPRTPAAQPPVDAPRTATPSASLAPEQAQPSSETDLAACDAESVRPGNAILRCVGFRLWIVQPINEAPAIVLERIRRVHEHGAGAGSLEPATLRILAKEFPAYSYSRGDGQEVVFGRVEGEDGRSLIASCIALPGNQERCIDALEKVARHGLPAHARAPVGAPKIGDREISLSSACTLVGNNRIRCPSAEFHWGDATGGSEEGVADGLEAGLRRLGSVKRSRVKCRLLDAVADCHVYTVARPVGPMTVVVGIADTPFGRLFSQCNSFDTARGLTPPPCDQILSVDQ